MGHITEASLTLERARSLQPEASVGVYLLGQAYVQQEHTAKGTAAAAPTHRSLPGREVQSRC